MKRILALLAFSASAIFAQNPTIESIVNNFGGDANRGRVAQGAIFAVKGSNLADQTTETNQNAPLTTNLKNVQIRITVGGTTAFAPLYHAFGFQVAGILPSSLPTGNGTLVVINNGKTSAPAAITVERSRFGMLTLNGAGTGGAAVHNEAYVLLSNSNATNPGKYLVFYGSGLGPTTGDETVAQTGVNASGDLTGIPITVTIGGKTALVLYHGRTEFPGLDQINVQVPTLDSGVYGCDVAVVITTNSVQANFGTIPVAQSGTTCPPPPNNGGGGGEGNGTSLTQSEIDRFISQGSYTSGNVGLTRTTIYGVDLLTSAQTITKKDAFSAQFGRLGGPDLGKVLRNELPPGYPTAIPGGCAVFNYNQFLVNPFPNLTSVNLDAGTPLTSVGPNGTQTVARTNQQVAGPSYYTENIPNTYIAPGRYTFSGPGGSQVGSFSGNVDIVSDFVLTNPTSFLTVNRNSPLNVAWTGGDSRSYMTIQGLSYTTTGTGSGFICIVRVSLGSFQVPANVLQQLAASEVLNPAPGISFVTRGSFSVTVGGYGARFTPPSGLDVLSGNNFWSWQFATQFQ